MTLWLYRCYLPVTQSLPGGTASPGMRFPTHLTLDNKKNKCIYINVKVFNQVLTVGDKTLEAVVSGLTSNSLRNDTSSKPGTYCGVLYKTMNQHHKSDLPEANQRSSEQLWQRNVCLSVNQSKLMRSQFTKRWVRPSDKVQTDSPAGFSKTEKCPPGSWLPPALACIQAFWNHVDFLPLCIVNILTLSEFDRAQRRGISISVSWTRAQRHTLTLCLPLSFSIIYIHTMSSQEGEEGSSKKPFVL